MSWVCIRKFTEEDKEKLNQRAEEFARRHGLVYTNYNYNGDEVWQCVDTLCHALHDQRVDTKILYLWINVFRRVVKEKYVTGVAHGYIGRTGI